MTEGRPFLLLSIRAEDDAADDEYRSVQRFAGVGDAGLRRIRLTHESLGHIDLSEWSGIILGGGPFNVSDPDALKSAVQVRAEGELAELLGRVIAEDFPFIGCCYGVGTLGSAIGARIDRSYSEPVGAVTVTLTEAGRADPLFADLPETFDAYGGHKEAVAELPPRRGASGVVGGLSRAGVPGGGERVRDAVSPGVGRRESVHTDRYLQELRVFSA